VRRPHASRRITSELLRGGCSRNRPIGRRYFRLAGNAAWTLASIALLFSGAVTPNLLGEVFVAAQAIAVGALAELQYIGLRQSGGAVTA